ncbi:hypothetical protein [Pseudoblastomonas halimionae]|uniref:Lipoprotein n=1 Tax=Alteriqipengyuania halimionae TaxID=1926630 RepID=A0A6I4U1H1_9SPHN|nr:hypothetical protein [Alteriqipengyuania halimionae]MXP09919.1 hypothetical protein [Alteriqipengyuania halimionae]
MRAIAVTALFGLLAACGGSEDDTTTVTTPESDVVIDDSGDGEQVRITSKDGESIKIAKRGGNDAKWPQGFSPYPGATVTSDITMGGGPQSGQIITFESDDSAEEIVAFYRRQAEAAGFGIKMDLKVETGRMLTGQTRDDAIFSINARAVEEGTEASLTVGRGG